MNAKRKTTTAALPRASGPSSAAMTPRWWQHSRLRAMELEEESVTHGHGLYLGIRAAVKAELQRLQFKPHPSELESLAWAQTPKPPCTPKAA